MRTLATQMDIDHLANASRTIAQKRHDKPMLCDFIEVACELARIFDKELNEEDCKALEEVWKQG